MRRSRLGIEVLIGVLALAATAFFWFGSYLWHDMPPKLSFGGVWVSGWVFLLVIAWHLLPDIARRRILDNAPWFVVLGMILLAVAGVSAYRLVPQQSPLEKRIENLEGFAYVLQHSQSLDANNQMAATARQALLSRWERLKEAMALRERSIGKPDLAERSAAAEHILNELTALSQSTRILAMRDGPGVIIETAPNTFRITFPVPMAAVPTVGFKSVPEGSMGTVVEKSKIGATIVYSPMTIPISIDDVHPFFSTDF